MSRVRRCLILSVVLVGWLASAPLARAADPQLAHMVYFTLAEKSPAAKAKLVAACQKYLSGHEGTVFFSVGTRAEDLQRDVNDQTHDVALLVVFGNKAAHDQYQTHARHLKFVEDCKQLWSTVRVFDAYLAPEVPAGSTR